MKWRKVTLNSISKKVLSGGTPLTSRPDYYNGDIPWAKTKEVNFNRIFDTEVKITQIGLDNSSAKLIPPRSVLIAMYGNGDTAGRCAINMIPLATNQACCNFTFDETLAYPEFMFYLISNHYRDFVNLKSGGAQLNLNGQTLKDFEVIIPPLPTQQKIASILSAYDDLIENNLKRIRLLEEAAQNLYREWFVQFRFPATEAAPGYEDAEFVDGLPKGWERRSLIHLCKTISSGGTPSRNKPTYWNSPDFEWIRTKELQDDFIHLAEEYISREGLENSSAKLFPEGTIVMAIYASPTLGRMGILTRDACFNQASVGFVVDENFISNEFLYYKLLEERTNLNNKAIGAAQQNINVQKVKDHEVLLPNKELIDKFTLWVKPLFEQRKKLGAQNLKLKEARDILLPRLMNQTIKV